MCKLPFSTNTKMRTVHVVASLLCLAIGQLFLWAEHLGLALVLWIAFVIGLVLAGISGQETIGDAMKRFGPTKTQRKC